MAEGLRPASRVLRKLASDVLSTSRPPPRRCRARRGAPAAGHPRL